MELKDKDIPDCLRCPHFPCLNYMRERQGEGVSELAALFDKETYKKYPPCHVGALIWLICILARIAHILRLIRLPEEDLRPLYLPMIECIRDLRTSLLLLLIRRYKASMIMLRSALEWFLLGLLFDTEFFGAEEKEERRKVLEYVREFYQTGFYKPLRRKYPKRRWIDIRILADELKERQILTDEMYNFLTELKKELSGFVHPRRLPKRLELDRICSIICPCPALVKWEEDDYRAVICYFQKVAAFMLDHLISYYDVFKDLMKNTNIKEFKDLANSKTIFLKVLAVFTGMKKCGVEPIMSEELKRIINERILKMLRDIEHRIDL